MLDWWTQGLAQSKGSTQMDKETLDLLQRKIDAMASGNVFDLKTLMGSDWTTIQNKQSFGRVFKQTVTQTKLTGLFHHELANSPRRDTYKKL